jgi:PAS domain S-box-containing protein
MIKKEESVVPKNDACMNRRLESELLKSQAETLAYRHALDVSSIIAITDRNGIITYVNDNFCRISKYTREELVGQDHRLVNSGFHPPSFFSDMWNTIAGGEVWRGELKNRAKDGSTYWVETTIVPFLNEAGEPYQYLAIRWDISSRKLAEAQILQINEDLERTVRGRTLELTQALEREKALGELNSRFVSVASHEFRTPLSAILSSLSLVELYAAAGQEEKRGRHLARIKSSVRNLTDILDEFLALDKLEQGRVETHPVPLQLRMLIEDIAREMKESLHRKEHFIVYSQQGNIELLQDRSILLNVLRHLLSNASKYSGVGLPIQVHAKRDGERVQVSVIDEGIGIPANASRHLFTKFYRADNVTNIQGTGLGLHIVLRCLDLLGGSIRYESTPGEGSTFTIDLPQKGRIPRTAGDRLPPQT